MKQDNIYLECFKEQTWLNSVDFYDWKLHEPPIVSFFCLTIKILFPALGKIPDTFFTNN